MQITVIPGLCRRRFSAPVALTPSLADSHQGQAVETPTPGQTCPSDIEREMSYFPEMDKTPESIRRQAAVEFIIVELDLAFTFCQLALSTHNLVRADRNIDNAKHALQTALRFEKRVDFRLGEKQIIDQKVFRVESLLTELAPNGGSGDRS